MDLESILFSFRIREESVFAMRHWLLWSCFVKFGAFENAVTVCFNTALLLFFKEIITKESAVYVFWYLVLIEVFP